MVGMARGYSAGKFMLALAGVPVGLVGAVEGGEPFATVAPRAARSRRSLCGQTSGPRRDRAVRVFFGARMEVSFSDWISEFTNGRRRLKNSPSRVPMVADASSRRSGCLTQL